jgi:hypothetical protein
MAESCKEIDKLWLDMYEGNGKDNPPVTARLATLESEQDRMKHDLYSNGQVGFIQETRDYIAKQKGMWMAVIALGILLTIMQGMVTIRDFMRPIIPLTHEQQTQKQSLHSFEE